MRFIRHVVVFDAADIAAESEFWARLVGGRVIADDSFHCVIDAVAADALAMGAGARVLRADHDLHSTEGHRVYADPAGHPFCIGWGHPDEAALGSFLDRQPPARTSSTDATRARNSSS